MKVNLNTTLEYETRLKLDLYCSETGESISATLDRALVEYLDNWNVRKESA